MRDRRRASPVAHPRAWSPIRMTGCSFAWPVWPAYHPQLPFPDGRGARHPARSVLRAVTALFGSCPDSQLHRDRCQELACLLGAHLPDPLQHLLVTGVRFPARERLCRVRPAGPGKLRRCNSGHGGHPGQRLRWPVHRGVNPGTDDLIPAGDLPPAPLTDPGAPGCLPRRELRVGESLGKQNPPWRRGWAFGHAPTFARPSRSCLVIQTDLGTYCGSSACTFMMGAKANGLRRSSRASLTLRTPPTRVAQGICGVPPGRPTEGGSTWESCSRWTGTGLGAAAAGLSTRVARTAGRAPGHWPLRVAATLRSAPDC